MFAFQNMQPPIIVNDVLTRSHSQLSLSVLFSLSLSSVCFLSITFSQLTIYYRICWHLPSSHDNCERGRETGKERERESPTTPKIVLSTWKLFFFVCFVVSFGCCCFWKFKLRPYAIIGVIKFLFAEIKWYVSSPVICLGARSLTWFRNLFLSCFFLVVKHNFRENDVTRRKTSLHFYCC